MAVLTGASPAAFTALRATEALIVLGERGLTGLVIEPIADQCGVHERSPVPGRGAA